MHNPLGPWKEVQDLYIQPSQLAKRLQTNPSKENFVLYDVGLGAGANAMSAVLSAFDAMKDMNGATGLRLISFEKDLSLARFALKHRIHFKEFSWAWDAFKELLEQGQWEHPEYELTWELYNGDFLDSLNQLLPIADLIFYDPYSPKKNDEMWTYSSFCKLREKCHAVSDRATVFLTYSRATKVRTALLLAGFYVGYGSSIGLKEETTVAATLKEALEQPLDQRWLERWQRSHTRFPSDLSKKSEEDTAKWIERLARHPQFSHRTMLA